jgi:hypothetical protein
MTRVALDCDSLDRCRRRRHIRVASSRHFASVNQWWLAWVSAASFAATNDKSVCVVSANVGGTSALFLRWNKRTSGEAFRAWQVDRGTEAFEWHPSCTVCDHERAYSPPPPPPCESGTSSRLESSCAAISRAEIRCGCPRTKMMVGPRAKIWARSKLLS